MRAIVLLSGWMDSLVTAAIAHKECSELYFLHFSYGQRTQERELKAFWDISRRYEAKDARVIDYQWLAEIKGSSLTDSSLEIKEGAQGIPNSYVPFRNATMLCAATAWAEVLKADAIYIGAVQEDSSGYPDCRESFFDAFERVIKEGTVDSNLKIKCPVIHMSKAEIVAQGLAMDAPFELSWSCYTASDLACGECPSCRLRLAAFAKAGSIDPIKYKG